MILIDLKPFLCWLFFVDIQGLSAGLSARRRRKPSAIDATNLSPFLPWPPLCRHLFVCPRCARSTKDQRSPLLRWGGRRPFFWWKCVYCGRGEHRLTCLNWGLIPLRDEWPATRVIHKNIKIQKSQNYKVYKHYKKRIIQFIQITQ